ncbi:MAG TPA: DUF6259 domain-containing protein [Steroidobacteraceae bacterium]|nr:DUF6259 domain-containing protein [Steroidobacteraceae bacterium]
MLRALVACVGLLVALAVHADVGCGDDQSRRDGDWWEPAPEAPVRIDLTGYTHVLRPAGHGRYEPIASALGRRRYPSQAQTMQFMAFFAPESGQALYVQTQVVDPVSIVDWELGARELRLYFYDARQTDVIVDRSLAPRWQAAAERYRSWSSKQFWAHRARSSGKLSPRYIHFYGDNVFDDPWTERRVAPVLRAFSGSARPGTATFFVNWGYQGINVGAPFYDACPPEQANCRRERDFRNFLTTLRDRFGSVPLPYTNASLWDGRQHNAAPTAQRAPGFLLRLAPTRSQQPTYLRYPQIGGKDHCLLVACPASAAWRQAVRDVQLGIKDSRGRPTPGVYLDVATAMHPRLCYATDHGHAPGSPSAPVEGTRTMLRQALADHEYVMAEGAAEVYIDLVDSSLLYLGSASPASVPLFAAVYGNLVDIVGWEMPEAARPADLCAAIERAEAFGVSAFGSPWMTRSDTSLQHSDSILRDTCQLTRNPNR